MSHPRVSVVVPVHDGEATIDRAIGSIVDQTMPDWEMLVVDDGSTDGSWARCRAWADRDARIRCLRFDDNRGLAAAMNVLVAETSAPLIAIQEQDDRSVPERLALQVAAMAAETDAGMCFGRARLLTGKPGGDKIAPPILEPGGRYPATRDAMIEMMFIGRNQVQNPTLVYRRDALAGTPGFDERARLAVDLQMQLRVAHTHRVIGLPHVLVDVNRGALAPHASQDRDLAERERRRCLRLIHRAYRRDPDSPVTTDLYRRALSAQMLVEGRRRGGLAGVPRLVAAAALGPETRPPWRSLREAVGNGLGRFRRRALSP